MRAVATMAVAAACLAGAEQGHAGAWTLPQGRVWLKTGFHYLLTDEQYAPAAAILGDGTRVGRGDSRRYNDGGAMRMRLWWNEAEIGLHDRVTAGLQLPFYDLRFEDRFQRTDSWGIGDIRVCTRVALLDRDHRLTLRAAWKLPVGKAATDPDDVPLSEGQHDLDLGIQVGRSLGRQMSWAGVEGGRRFRYRDEETGREPGDEWFWRAEAGFAPWRARPIAVRASWEGLRGGETRYDDLGLLTGQRRYDQLSLGILFALREWTIEGGFSRTLAGEAYPAGYSWSFGLSRSLSLRG